MRLFICLLCVLFFGCTAHYSPPKPHPTSQPSPLPDQLPYAQGDTIEMFEIGSCPYVAGNDHYVPGSKYIPSIHTYIDWSEDFYNWHYHGRDRQATSEEIQLHQLEIEISKDIAQRDVDALRTQYESLLSQYKHTLDQLYSRDQEYVKNKIISLKGY